MIPYMFWSGVLCGYVATALMYRKLMYKEVNTIYEENSNFKRKIKIVNKAFMKCVYLMCFVLIFTYFRLSINWVFHT